MGKQLFGVSTHLYRAQRLRREHLLEIASHGFEAVEVVAVDGHIDYRNPATVADLQQWLAEAGLELANIHATGGWDDAEHALHIARRIPARVLVVHANVGSRDAARKGLEHLARAGEPLGVTVGVEVLVDAKFRANSVVHFVEHEIDARVGICLDVGHARIAGDVVEAIESVSEHLVAVDVHDNRGRTDDHLPPFDGMIDWPSALTMIQKIGFDGPLMFEVSGAGSAKDTLARLRTARERFERFLCMSI